MKIKTILNIATFTGADYAMVTMNNGDIKIGHARSIVNADNENFDFSPTEQSRYWITVITSGWFDIFIPIGDVQEVQALDQESARDYAKSLDAMAS